MRAAADFFAASGLANVERQTGIKRGLAWKQARYSKGPSPEVSFGDGPFFCGNLGSLGEMSAMNENPTQPPREARPVRPPPLLRQAWNLAAALTDFVADGCQTVSEEQYRQRLEICDGCDQRRGNRCMKCGCRLSLKARGRAFQCPLGKWPDIPTR